MWCDMVCCAVQLSTQASSSLVMSAKISNNGGSTARVLCVFGMLLNLIFTIDTFVMVGFRGRDGMCIASPPVCVLSCIDCLVFDNR